MNEIAPACDCHIIHQDTVDRIKNVLPPDDSLQMLSDLFKVLGDLTRIKIISVLFESEMCVCDIAAVLDMSHSAISHQLRVLKQSRLVRYRRAGKSIYYSLDDDHISHIFHQGIDHIKE